MSNIAKELLWPTDSRILVRVVFLYVGQGASALVLVADGDTYQTLLLDINLDPQCGGINVPHLMVDLLDDNALNVFVNTHPHNDHLCGLKDLGEVIKILEVWHSGHIPGKDHCDLYNDLQEVIKKVKAEGGTEIALKGSREVMQIGEVDYYVLSPAKYIVDEISDESAETRYRRIHEHCAVIKFGKEPTWIMIPGDADRNAWEQHITDYHKERLASVVFAAPHHGSRTFFRYAEEDEAYKDALQGIDPEYVIISAPTQQESKHDHPHDSAVKLYVDHVGEDNVLHTGEQRHSYICDIFRDGNYQVLSDNGDLAEAYPCEEGKSSDGKTDEGSNSSRSAYAVTRVDHRPMGSE